MDSQKIKERLLDICILDGRNRDKVKVIEQYFSEFALMKYRIYVEISYLIFINTETKIMLQLSGNENKILKRIWQQFSLQDAIQIKAI